jgi:hypothetical protein
MAGAIGVSAKAASTYDKTSSALLVLAAGVAAAFPAGTVVGIVLAAVGLAVKLFGALLGSGYATTTEVRWLTQLYESYVIGTSTPGANEVNEKYTNPSWQWFHAVSGVPIYDRLRFNALAGVTGDSSVDLDISTRVAAYMAYPEVLAQGITPDQATDAALILENMISAAGWPHMKIAAWANQPVAAYWWNQVSTADLTNPDVVAVANADSIAASSPTAILESGGASVLGTSSNSLLYVVGAAIILMFFAC